MRGVHRSALWGTGHESACGLTLEGWNSGLGARAMPLASGVQGSGQQGHDVVLGGWKIRREGKVMHRLEGEPRQAGGGAGLSGQEAGVASQSHISPAARKCPGQYI